MVATACATPVRPSTTRTSAPPPSASASVATSVAVEPSPTVTDGAIAWSRAAAATVEGVPATASIVVRAADGTTRVVARDARYRMPPAWSPDGGSLAFVGSGSLSVWRPGEGTEQVLGCVPPVCLGLGPPAWSPDGSTVAFAVTGDDGDGLVVTDMGDPELEVVADVVADGPPTWSPDGTSLAIASGDRIVVLDARDGTITSSVAFRGRLGDRLSWSPDGTTFAVDGTSDGASGIFLVAIDGGAPLLLSACPDDGCTDLDPAWTADGREVVFTRARCDLPGGDCYTGDLFVVEGGGGGAARPLVTDRALDCCAAVQPVLDP